MPNYEFSAIDAKGKTKEGVLVAETEGAATTLLKMNALYPVSVAKTIRNATVNLREIDPADDEMEPDEVDGKLGEEVKLLVDDVCCTLAEAHGTRTEGTLNIVVEDDKHLLAFRRGSSSPLKIPLSEVVSVTTEGWFRRRLLVHATNSRSYRFEGNGASLRMIANLIEFTKNEFRNE